MVLWFCPFYDRYKTFALFKTEHRAVAVDSAYHRKVLSYQVNKKTSNNQRCKVPNQRQVNM
jgi:hypothetical protein